MLDEYLYLQQKRRRARRWEDFKAPLLTLLCSLAIGYLLTAALVGLLAS